MLVGLGSRQSIDFSGATVETFTTNTAAMVDAVQESFPSTWTPLSESLYETARYIAQINSTYVAWFLCLSHCLCRRHFKRRGLWGVGGWFNRSV